MNQGYDALVLRETCVSSQIMNRENILRQRIKCLTWIFILGLVFSGATAIPLPAELDALAGLLHLTDKSSADVADPAKWLLKVREALHDTDTKYPFLAYGTDWLAFGHFVIAIAFIGALRDPVRNAWLFTFGMIACALVVPYAFVFGALRGIPLGWRLIDCSFGIVGILPVWYCRKSVLEMERLARNPATAIQSGPSLGNPSKRRAE
jgi:hypothetical protein